MWRSTATSLWTSSITADVKPFTKVIGSNGNRLASGLAQGCSTRKLDRGKDQGLTPCNGDDDDGGNPKELQGVVNPIPPLNVPP